MDCAEKGKFKKKEKNMQIATGLIYTRNWDAL